MRLNTKVLHSHCLHALWMKHGHVWQSPAALNHAQWAWRPIPTCKHRRPVRDGHHCWLPVQFLSGRFIATTSAASAADAPTAGEDMAAQDTADQGLGFLKRGVEQARQRLDAVLQVVDLPAARARLNLLEHEASQGQLWDQPERAQAYMTQINSLRNDIDNLTQYNSQLEEASFAIELLEADQGMSPAEATDITSQAFVTLQQLNKALESWEMRRLLSGPYDEKSARLSITAGAGGVDAMDWAEMLERMYTRWAAARSYAVRVEDRSQGDTAGIKSVELLIEGPYAYGHLRSEKGTHRLVRQSPFNAKGLRQTSFAGVEVLPVLDGQQVELDLKDSDLQFQFMRASGAGGQNVNKVETGVRITHLPTGISVKCTQERSQVQNKALALDMLRAKLLVIMQEQAAAQVAELRGDMVKADWGQQIRNYVLHPYKLVKDTRTGEETSDITAVLDGDLDSFISAFLRRKGQDQTAAALTAVEGSV